MAPVAMPSSTTITMRPANGSAGASARKRRARWSTSARSLSDDALQDVVVDPALREDVRVGDQDAALPHGSHRHLRLAGQTQFAHDDHIEWGMQRRCHLERHRHPAARQTHDDHVLPPVGGQRVTELASGVSPVLEAHAHGTCTVFGGPLAACSNNSERDKV